MRIGELGEFGVIARIERAARRQGKSRAVALGIGDDAAVLRARPGEDVVVSTDAQVEDVHFRWRTQSPRVLGRRALVASLSDLAAMGARPLGFTFALAAPPGLPVPTLDGIVAGLLHEARRYACVLVGGNVTRARQTSLTLTVLGAVRRGCALTRRGVRRGDGLFVTGTLGGAALELARAERGRGRIRHVPVPRLSAGQALARIPQVTGCIDVSDGLEADLAHLLGPLGAELDLSSVPRPARFNAACAQQGLDAQSLALGGGEDYELLFSVRPPAPSITALRRRLGVRVSQIGRVTGPRKGRQTTAGYRHFGSRKLPTTRA